MSVVRWIFTDPVLSTTYTFEINPNDGGSPTYKKNLTTVNTTAPAGAVLIFEGADQPMAGTFSGTILTQSQYHAMTTWFSKRYPITVTDDLGRTQTIYITGFNPKRQRSALYPYKHTYQVDYTVLSLTDL